MTLWLDAHISPAIASWIRKEFAVEAWPLRDLNLRDASDTLIFNVAREKNAVLMTKDSDFVALQTARGAPPKVILLAFGNTSDQNLKRVLAASLGEALRLLESGESLVEIQDSNLLRQGLNPDQNV